MFIRAKLLRVYAKGIAIEQFGRVQYLPLAYRANKLSQGVAEEVNDNYTHAYTTTETDVVVPEVFIATRLGFVTHIHETPNKWRVKYIDIARVRQTFKGDEPKYRECKITGHQGTAVEAWMMDTGIKEILHFPGYTKAMAESFYIQFKDNFTVSVGFFADGSITRPVVHEAFRAR